MFSLKNEFFFPNDFIAGSCILNQKTEEIISISLICSIQINKHLIDVFKITNEFKKIVYNNEENCHNTTVLRENDTVDTDAVIDVKININKIQLQMPHLFLADIVKFDILKAVDKGQYFPIFFRQWDFIEQPVQAASKSQNWTIKTTSLMERPRYVLEFQTKKENRNSENYSIFDHCVITNVKLFLNSNFYPIINRI